MPNIKTIGERGKTLPEKARKALYLEEAVRDKVLGGRSVTGLPITGFENITGGDLKIGIEKPVCGLFDNLPYSSQGWRRMDFEDPAMRGPHRAGPLQIATYALAGLGISAILAFVAPAGGLSYLIGISTSALLAFSNLFSVTSLSEEAGGSLKPAMPLRESDIPKFSRWVEVGGFDPDPSDQADIHLGYDLGGYLDTDGNFVLGLPTGLAIYPVADGVVTGRSDLNDITTSPYHQFVTIKHDGGTITEYVHVWPEVDIGQRVTRDDKLGILLGAGEGAKSGPSAHLHLNVEKEGKTLDPRKALGFKVSVVESVLSDPNVKVIFGNGHEIVSSSYSGIFKKLLSLKRVSMAGLMKFVLSQSEPVQKPASEMKVDELLALPQEQFLDAIYREESEMFPDLGPGLQKVKSFHSGGKGYGLFHPSWYFNHGMISQEMVRDLRQHPHKKVLMVGDGPAYFSRFLVERLGVKREQITVSDLNDDQMPADFDKVVFDMWDEWPKEVTGYDYIFFPESIFFRLDHLLGDKNGVLADLILRASQRLSDDGVIGIKSGMCCRFGVLSDNVKDALNHIGKHLEVEGVGPFGAILVRNRNKAGYDFAPSPDPARPTENGPIYSITYADVDDVESLRPIARQWVRKGPDGQPMQDDIKDAIDRLGKGISKGTHKVLVAKNESGEVIGFFAYSGRVSEIRKLARTSNPIELTDVYVDSGNIRKGIGTALMKRLEEDARGQGATEILVGSAPWFKESGWGFYDSLPGFERVGAVLNYGKMGQNAQVWSKVLDTAITDKSDKR